MVRRVPEIPISALLTGKLNIYGLAGTQVKWSSQLNKLSQKEITMVKEMKEEKSSGQNF